MIFFAAGNNEKKNIYKEKRKTKIYIYIYIYMVQIWNGLLPNCIFREWELYCNTEICIAVRNLGGVKIVLQGSDCIARWVYCELKG